MLAVLLGLVAALPSPAQLEARALSLRQLAGHVILMRFDGNPPARYVTRTLRHGEAAGVILFRDNATDPAATRALTQRLQRAAHQRALIATDQEGGVTRILGWASPSHAQSTEPAPAAAARAAARDLRAAGVNVNLAPVADRPGPGTLMRLRAFGGHTARKVAEAVRAYRGTGVAPTLKHFPGLGGARGNTDKARVTITGTPDLRPFATGIAAGAPAVMVSHARYTALDPHAIASQSHRIVTGLLKRRLGFTGVAMTDSLEAYSVRSRMSMETAAVRSIHAGIDLLVTTGQGTHIRALRALVARAHHSRAFRARLTDAAARVIALQTRVRSGS